MVGSISSTSLLLCLVQFLLDGKVLSLKDLQVSRVGVG